jgi:hypothetical protein
MAAAEFEWIEDSLTDEDKRLIDAYAYVGRPVDDLAYTEDFDQLVGVAHNIDADQVPMDLKQRAFRRLLNLRKRGRLPRLVHSSESSD